MDILNTDTTKFYIPFSPVKLVIRIYPITLIQSHPTWSFYLNHKPIYSASTHFIHSFFVMIFFDISIGGVPTGRLIVSLAHDVVPKTCHNFTQLVESKKYKNTTFHRIIPNFMIQGGDYENHNGTGGSSIYGGKFDDEVS